MKKLSRFSLLFLTISFFAYDISAQTEQKAELVVQRGHSGRVSNVVFSPDGRVRRKMWRNFPREEPK